MNKNTQEIARLMHETYEDKARMYGWATQDSCRVDFDDLPEENKKTIMKLENLVSSLPLSQEYARLMKEKGKELPSSHFVWSKQEDGVTWKVEYRKFFAVDMRRDVVALTSGEIGEILSEVKFKSSLRELYFGWSGFNFWAKTKYDSHDEKFIESPTEADARLKMLNYLLANGLI